jgi:lipopolysaccharide export system permease protein
VFNDLIVPSANLAAADTLDSALGRSIAAERGDNVVYSRYAQITRFDEKGKEETGNDLAQLFYARRFREGRMYEVTLLDFTKAGHQQMLIAKTGVWNEPRSMWEFRDGRIVDIDSQNNRTTSADFDRYFYPFTKAPLDVGKLPSDAAQMTVSQALRAEAMLEQAGDRKEARRLRVRIQEKFAFPAICLVFGLIGSSLGVRPNARTSRSQGFGISVLLIFGYYLMSFIFSSLGIKGTLMPFFAAWMPVLIGLAGGLVLLRQASR